MSFYGTVLDADAYHLARGNAAWAAAASDAKQAALTTGTDYVDSFRADFPGAKTGGRAQEREWPRTSAADAAGEAIPTDEVPREAEYAVYEAALMVVSGISLTAVPSSSAAQGRVIYKRVKGGPVETETHWSESEALGNERPWFQKIEDLLSNILTGPGALSGATVGLLRI